MSGQGNDICTVWHYVSTCCAALNRAVCGATCRPAVATCRVATCRPALQRVATCGTAMQVAAPCCKVSHCVATERSVATCCDVSHRSASVSSSKRPAGSSISTYPVCACMRAHARACVLGLYIYRIATYRSCVCAHARELPQGGLRARDCVAKAPLGPHVREAWRAAGLAATLADSSHRRYPPRIV